MNLQFSLIKALARNRKMIFSRGTGHPGSKRPMSPQDRKKAVRKESRAARRRNRA